MKQSEKKEESLLNSELIDIKLSIEKLNDSIQSKNKEKWFGKYHDVLLLLIGFILTTIAGGFISYVYQKKMFDYQKQVLIYENKQNEILKVYNQVTKIIVMRNVMGKRLVKSIEDKEDPSEIKRYYDKYYESVDAWVENDAYNREFINVNFSLEAYHDYENISRLFVDSLHPNILNIYKKKSDSTSIPKVKNWIKIQNDNNASFFKNSIKTVFYKDTE